MAYVGTALDDLNRDLNLYSLSLPDAAVSVLTPLTSDETGIHSDDDDSVKWDIAAAIGHRQSLAWSPDGQWLAFVGAMDGPSADLYSYQLSTGAIRWLSDGPFQAYQLLWREDSRQILHSAADCFLCAGGSYEGGQGIWGAAPDGSAVVKYEHPASARFVVWQDAHHLLIDTGDRNGGLGNMRVLDVASGSIEALGLGNFELVAYDDSGRYAVLYSLNDSDLMQDGYGFYWVDLDTRETRFLQDTFASLWWDHYAQRFLIAGDSGYIAVALDGTVTQDASTTSQAPSPDGRFSAWFDSAPRPNWDGGLWLQTGNGEQDKVLDGGGLDLQWSPDSQSFFYNIGPGLYLVIAESRQVIPLFNEPGLPKTWPYTTLKWQATWVPHKAPYN